MTAEANPLPEATPVRQSQKEATRRRVIAAARELFDAHGYEGTTIREIARHAGVAVGSVFTTFASKGEILSEVMAARLELLYAEVDRVMPHVRGSTVDRLRTMFAIHFEFEARHVRLFLAHIAAAFDHTLSGAARPYGRNEHFQQVIRDILQAGIRAGEVRPDIDMQEAVDLMMAAYAWTYRIVVTTEADAKALIAVMDRQLGLIVAGLAPER
ncbi:MAG: TetR/AcrR family transcriptional regulator [Phenylobacterium sp.]|uniref:TetR/AcrR family transcriptional regulator n=1 Tax=Phenylobacterium sp. TaxID=1871053 RepID=UPI001A456518|nr:TetR/AcrR family transcriptional regulator [Phenylobacterium sp.]MBL8773006.1 TetR/AcrR family transcriptional regulator [Phenylobacterium sp.]